MAAHAEVTVCVPVYNGAPYVAEALQSVLAQSFGSLRVLVAVDPSTDGSLDACRAFERDPRVKVFAQPQRRGWVGNANDLLARVESDYFFIMAQDDRIAPGYVAALHERLAREAAAVCAYSDIEIFGASANLVQQTSLTGALERRLAAFLLGQMPAVALRGLVARGRLPAPPRLRHNAAGDFAADTVWMLDLAVAGELQRVEGPVYEKRVHDDSETQRWKKRTPAEQLEGWIEHCAQCARIALDAVPPGPGRALLTVAAVARFNQWHTRLIYHADLRELAEPERRAALGRFLERAGIPTQAGMPRDLARQSPLAAELPPALHLTRPAHEEKRAAEEHHRRGKELQAAKQLEASVREFRQALERDPALAIAFRDLGVSTAQLAIRAAPAKVPPPPAPRAPDLSVSVVVCSIQEERRQRVRAEYQRAFAGRRFELIEIGDAKSLAEAYNRGAAQSTGEIVVFSHDDIEILGADFADRLLNHFASCDLVGVAGATRIAGPSWIRAYRPWLHGCVVHESGRGAYTFDWYGPPRPSGVQALDGLFFAATRRLWEAVRFDAQAFDGFHLYDTDFSYRAHLAGFRVAAACDLLLLHHSRGTFDERWEKYATRFMDKHGATLLVDSPLRKIDWSAIRFDSRPALLEYHRLMQEAVKGL